jgi:hypothetical protein
MPTVRIQSIATPLTKWPSKIVTLLRIEENPPGKVVFDYEEDDLTFKTSKTNQTLFVQIDSPETFGSPPHSRFHLHRIEYTRPDLVDGVEHSLSDHTSTKWSTHVSGQDMPPYTKSLKLKLKIKGKDVLYVKVVALDLKTCVEVPCDPLVGNDPPKGGEEEQDI